MNMVAKLRVQQQHQQHRAGHLMEQEEVNGSSRACKTGCNQKKQGAMAVARGHPGVRLGTADVTAGIVDVTADVPARWRQRRRVPQGQAHRHTSSLTPHGATTVASA
ncbi:unnamed protein product [Lampetra fluviatilis]